METKEAYKSKTIGFNAIVMGAIAALAAFGVDVPDGFNQAMMAAIPLFNILLRFVTNGAIRLGVHPTGESGRASVRTLLVLCASSTLLLVAVMHGCAGQSATEQMRSQTSDPGTIAIAVYADAQDAYIDAQELYLPYQQVLVEANPERNEEIVGCFRKANKILDNWGILGEIPADDKALFREYIRKITIGIAESTEQ